MIELIEIDQCVEPIVFDQDFPVNIVQITDKGINRAEIQPKRYDDRRSVYPIISTPTMLLPNDYIQVACESLPANEGLKSNKRLKRGKLVLPIPEGFSSIFIADSCNKNYQIEYSRGLISKAPNDIHLNNVVNYIKVNELKKTSKGNLTFSLRNRNMKAKDIENVLYYLVDCGALQKLEYVNKPMSAAGRKPSQEYLILRGKSEFFPSRSHEEVIEE